jgi:uncharacterized cofD-like protein
MTPLRIVAIGGGTGLSALLHGLKAYVRSGGDDAEPGLDITAVVTVTDDGGSSGRLRREFEILPPGDIRNCMVALSEEEEMLTRLFQYRFTSGRGLKGHSFGNLFLTALTDITGDFPQAVRLSSEILRIGGNIYPATSSNVALEATLADGTRVSGETRISKSRKPISRIQIKPKNCKPLPETLKAIGEADLITLGPGSLYTSVIPNLLVQGIPEAIRQSRAVKAYFVNLMWQPGETMHYSASDHVRAVDDHVGGKLLDYAVVNMRNIPDALIQRYARQKAMPVKVDLPELDSMGLEVVIGNLLQVTNKVRHSPKAVASVAIQLAREGRLRKELAESEAKKSVWKRQ